MKTLTEFSGFVLKDVLSKKAAWQAEGKSEEEVQAAINELLKLDEGKVPFFKNAVDMTQSRLDRVKRVVIALKSAETEKVPETFVEREGHFYLLEYFPQGGAEKPARVSDRGGSDRNSRGKGDRNRSSEGGGGSFGRGPRPERGRQDLEKTSERSPNRNTGITPLPENERKPYTPSYAAQPAKSPRPPRAAAGPKGAGELRLVLKGQTASTLTSPVSEGTAPTESAPESV